MTITTRGATFAGAHAAVAGSDDDALRTAEQLAHALAMTPFTVADDDRAAYHAAASIASNFLITLEWAAERIGGVDRAALAPLVRATVENWVAEGPRAALTGPIARGDEATVARQRAAVAERAPDLTAALRRARRRHPGPRGGRRMRTIRTDRRAARDPPRRRDGRARPDDGLPARGPPRADPRRARQQADQVVVSLFVNPAQFNDPADLDNYPRDEQRDAALASDAGADLLFAPAADEIYPPGFATQVRVGGPLTESLEGAHRGAEHFHGVTTVVTKLLNMVAPDVALFGQKDAQQALVIRRLVTDLDMPVRIEVVPTVREPDGLALSSRNVRLADDDRRRALALSRALRAAEGTVAAGAGDATQVLTAARAAMTPFGVEPEYLALVDPEDLSPVGSVDQETLLAVAAHVGPVRLIDNTILVPGSPGKNTIDVDAAVATPN